MLADDAIANVILRFAVLLGITLSAGSVLFAMTHRHTAPAVAPILRKQILIGACLVIIAEPLRWFVDQLSMSGGDISLALDPAMRWIRFEMPQGRAALVRILGVVMVTAFWARWQLLGIVGLTLALGSFAMEGHTAALAKGMPWLAAPLFLHLVAVSWWLAGLWPLAVLLRTASDEEARCASIEATSGAAAIPSVANIERHIPASARRRKFIAAMGDAAPILIRVRQEPRRQGLKSHFEGSV